jgi:hypothetical protein
MELTVKLFVVNFLGIEKRFTLLQYLRQNTSWPFFDKRVKLRTTKDQVVEKRRIIHFYPFLSTGEGIVFYRAT